MAFSPVEVRSVSAEYCSACLVLAGAVWPWNFAAVGAQCCGGTGSRLLAFFSAVALLCDSDPNKSCFASLPSKCGVEMALLLGTKGLRGLGREQGNETRFDCCSSNFARSFTLNSIFAGAPGPSFAVWYAIQKSSGHRPIMNIWIDSR